MIHDDLLHAAANRWLPGRLDEPAGAALETLAGAGGDFSWHLVVDCGDGQFRVLRFADLAAVLQAEPHRARDPLATFDLLPAPAVERASLGTGQARDLARRQPGKLLIVVQGGRAIGMVFEGSTLGADGPAPSVAAFVQQLIAATRLETAGPDGAPGGGADGADGGTDRERDGSRPGRSFEAHPALDAPAAVEPEQRFTVTVGLRRERDPELVEASPIRLDAVPDDAACTVTLLTDGARLAAGEAASQPLPLQLDASVAFECQAQPGAREIRLTAHYTYRSQLIGLATRRVAVGADAPLARRRGNPCRLGQATPATQADLQVTITRSRARPGYLQWTFTAPQPALHFGPVLTELPDAREFAALLVQELKTQEYKGLFAAQILANKAQDIADAMPPEFFDVLGQVHGAVGRPPAVLLLTDETYVPWELALLEAPLDLAAPPYLGAQVDLGRWILHERVLFPPPLELEITRLSAVASAFGLGTDQRELRHALAEQAHLQQRLGAAPLAATRAALQPLLGERVPGHLVHFAVHGLSDPEGNEQALLLADKTRLIPGALAGRHRCGETPAFGFVFLNACQVGTAASCLGQAAGFPGDLIRGGTRGFIGPLWDVDDAAAFALAQHFYTAVFDQGQPVAQVLRQVRSRYDPAGHTTAMAYVFYGHPKLKLKLLTPGPVGPQGPLGTQGPGADR